MSDETPSPGPSPERAHLSELIKRFGHDGVLRVNTSPAEPESAASATVAEISASYRQPSDDETPGPGPSVARAHLSQLMEMFGHDGVLRVNHTPTDPEPAPVDRELEDD